MTKRVTKDDYDPMKKIIETIVWICLAATLVWAGKWIMHPGPPKPYDPTEGFIQKDVKSSR